PLTGIESGVLEVVEDFDRNTYRAVYKVQLGNIVYVLHVFQKKSKSGKATPKPDVDLIRSRLKLAKQDYERRTKAKGKA
ncbi:MAG: type II toxin-antitoxin system RelE/ParE family toxin, partial [Deltaproteobacteria bacterium]